MKNPQGPFYPGQMRDWYTQGFFSQDHPVAPSFQGEMPQNYARIVEAFPQPLMEKAFVPGMSLDFCLCFYFILMFSGEGIAMYPPEEQPVEVVKEVTKEQLIRTLMQATPGQEFQASAISYN